FRYLHFPENLHQGICLKTPVRTNSANKNATSTAHVSSDSFHRLADFPSATSALIGALLSHQKTGVFPRPESVRFFPQNDALISATSCDATRPTINKAGAGSLSSLPSRATLDQRTCCLEPVACETITQGRSAGSPAPSNRSDTSA